MKLATAVTILVPLYIYPQPGAWDRLYTAITSYPDTQFLVIVNPQSGPGSAGWWPNVDYMREIPKLNSHQNVQTLGYVRAGFCQRDMAEVTADIDTYANRAKDDVRLQMQGIFLDETVNLYSPDVKEFLDAIDVKVKGTDGIGGNRTIIHNPGTSVNAELARPGPDITTTSEVSYDRFMSQEAQNWLATSPYDRTRSAFMINSVPIDKIEHLTLALLGRAQYLFLSDLKENFYEGFGDSWEAFVKAMSIPATGWYA